MIFENRLISEFQGESYDEQVTLTYNDTESIVLFSELSYMLVSSFDDELQMNLNFGNKVFLPYVLIDKTNKSRIIEGCEHEHSN